MFDFEEGSLNPYIEKSLKVAVHYLGKNHNRIYKLLNYNEGKAEDLAIDAIAPLFIKNGNEELPIKKSFDNWHPKIETEEEFSFFLNKVISNRVEQHITKLLKESDPLFDTIHNSINYLIRKNGNGKTKYLGTTYIIESSTKKIVGKIISQEAFEAIPGSHFSDDKKLLQNLFFYLKTETDFFPAIPLNALILKFKNLKSAGYSFVEKVESPVKTYEIKEFINKGLVSAKDKLDATYIRKKKLDKEEAQKLFEALKDISEDLKDGGVTVRLYEYLKSHFEELSPEDYKRKYHNILEYLFKVMRTTIAKELSK